MLLMHDFIKPGSPGFENVICLREIRQGIFKNTSKGFKMLSVRFEGFQGSPVHRESAEITAPGYPDSPEITVQRLCEWISGLRITHRSPWVRTRQNAEQQSCVFDRSCQGSFHRKAVPWSIGRPAWNPSQRRSKPDNVAVICRIS